MYLHDLATPYRQREGFKARIRWEGDKIVAIDSVDNHTPQALLELEAEEVMLFFGAERERRRLVNLSQIPAHVIHAVLAAEDNRFYSHRGFDLRGVLRALWTNLRHGAIRQGGSTITQQLVKNYFLTPQRSLARKLKELFMAITVEAMYTKAEILEIYLNEIYLGQKGADAVNGIGEASFFYFDKPVEDLLISEAATIAGLIKAPNHFSPYADVQRCRVRRDGVLRAMHKFGWLTPDALQQALEQPLIPAGYAAYGRKAPYFADYLSQQIQSLYAPEALTSLGMRIYTTLDTQVQQAAEEALRRGLERLEISNPALRRQKPAQRVQGAIVVMQPKTGYILAMVGGRDYGTSQFNRITQARRQPGSAFKPFVYLSALDEFTPASMLSNEPQVYEVDGTRWQPQNYAPVQDLRVTLREALARSINVPTVDLAMQLGLDKIIQTTHNFGISSALRAYPALALGASEVIPLELARAYCPFAADGLLPHPLSLKDVMDENGQMLERKHLEVQQVITPAKAFIMSSLMRSVVTTGTARSLSHLGIQFPVGGKTGTTNNYRDAWFVGFTPEILALVWIGFDDGTSIEASGAAAALPIWADMMQSIPQYTSGRWFTTPPGVIKRLVCPEGDLYPDWFPCPQPVEEFFLVERLPEQELIRRGSDNPFQQIIEGLIDVFR